MFFWLAPSFFDAAAINPNGIKTPLANSFITFSIKANPVLTVVLKVYLTIPVIVLFMQLSF